MAFAWLGYIGYCFIQHSTSTGATGGLSACAATTCSGHAKPNVNWGVSTVIWDRVFGTKV